jgi:4-amino-4-deoxy-L-arabinose transferase-like glycosyltransferase
VTAIAARRPAAARASETADVSTQRHRYLLWALLALTAILYLADLGREGWANDFYAAAVQAGTRSWKAFFFGSFDAANFITVDKTPAFLWPMELSARLFGLNSWSMLVPQAIEGVGTVALLYAAVRRWYGPWAALLAGLTLAVTPVAALMFRYNNPDAMLVLLMTAAAYATVRAIESGRTRWLVLAGALLGFGFLAKMLEAFLVLPAFGLAYLMAGPRRWQARLIQLLAEIAAVVVAAGWWVAAVMLTPAAYRPYVGGSTNNNILQLAIGYNGLGRIDGNETGSVGFGRSHGFTGSRSFSGSASLKRLFAGGHGFSGSHGFTGRGGAGFSGSAGLGRLFAADMGGQISWLLPAALLGIGALLWLGWRARHFNKAPAEPGHRPGRDLPAVLLWGGWLLVTGLVFSFMAGIIHPYYTIALAPAIAALIGIGAVRLQDASRTVTAARYWLGASVAVTAVWSFLLLDRSPAWLPPLRYAILAAGLAASVAIAVAPRLGDLAGTLARRRALPMITAGIAALALLAGPFAYTLDTIGTSHAGSLPSAGPAVAVAFGGPGRLGLPGLQGGGFGRPGRFAAGGFAAGKPGSGEFGPGGFGAGGFAPGGFGAGKAGTGGFGPSGFSTGSMGAGRFGAGGLGGLGGSTTVSAALTTLLERDASRYTWAAATVGSESAAPLQLATRDPVMSIGGFNGTDPAPTLAQFKQYVAEHKIHYFVGANAHSFGGGTGDAAAITKWVTSQFKAETVGGESVCNLTEPIRN